MVNDLMAEKKMDAAITLSLKNGVKDLFDQLATSHDSAETRLADVVEYGKKFYADYAGKPKAGDFVRIRNNREVKSILDSYNDTFVAINNIEEEKLGDAIKTLERITNLKSPVASHVLPNFWRYMALKQSGNEKDALAALKKTADLRDPYWPVVEALASRENALGKRDSAGQIVERGIEKFERTPGVYPKAVLLYRQLGLNDQASKLAGTCGLQFPEHRDACARNNRPIGP